MFIQDLRKDFYNLLIGKRVLVFVNYDIDGICASKIIQNLFRNEHIIFSVFPIIGINGLKKAFNEHKNDSKLYLFVNCGGTIDIVDLLQPEDDILFYICDSHRPLDVCNIYSDNQVRILGDPSKEEEIPQFDAIFRESDDEDDDESDYDDENEENRDSENLTRAERFEKRLQKNKERRDWESNRNQVMFNYTQYSFYARSSALSVFELAWQLSKDSLDLLWWAVVGITEQLLTGKIESSLYTLETQRIQSHVTRLLNKHSDNTLQTAIKITYENDLHLALYRHWSIKESLKNSIYSACKLKLWTLNGKKKMSELLVEMGLPLVQACQTFSSMDLSLKKEFYDMIERTAEKYNMHDIIYGSFTLQYGYKNRFSAADYVYSMIAILEQIEHNRSAENCFLEALDCLSRNKKNILENGIEKAKVLLSAIFRQVKISLETQQIFSAGPFLYYILQDENILFSSPYGLSMLAKFILRGFVAVSRSRRSRELPLIASVPIDLERGICLMIGVPPIGEDTKNLFGKAFEQAAIKSNAAISQDFFDTSLIQIKSSDCSKFIDALTVLLSS